MSSIEMVDVEKRAEEEMAPIMTKARAFAVVDEASYLAADEIAAEIKRRVKLRQEELGPMKESATKAWKEAVRIWKKYVDDPLAAVQVLDRIRYAWRKAEDKRRADEAEALRQEELRKVEIVRKAEADRVAAEAKRQADEALELAERLKANNMPEQADAVLEQAGQAEAEGVKKAEAIVAAPIAPTTVPVPAPIAKPVGQIQSEKWQARIVNPALVLREYCVPSQAKLNEYARLMKGRAICPGVVFEDVGKTSRRQV